MTALASNFTIDAEWKSADHGEGEVRHTSAFMRIAFDTLIATHSEDDRLKTVSDRVRLSAYPLAQWLAASWWRLRWESRREKPALSWRMSHETASAGYGFIWPRLTFASDGEFVSVRCHPSRKVATEPVRYLSDFMTIMPASLFERTIDAFMDHVLARLGAVGLPKTDLRELWDEVQEERRDPEAYRYRKLEAQLGYDPDDAPDGLVDRFLGLTDAIGPQALEEIAPVCAGPDPEAALQRITSLTQPGGAQGRLGLSPVGQRPGDKAAYPYERGWRLAHQVRSALALPGGPVSNRKLADVLSMRPDVIEPHDPERPPLALAVRDDLEGGFSFHFSKKPRHGRRFEAARLLADLLLAPADERWLPLTSAKTARQKVQRAFAAEFLCPVEELKAFLKDDFSDSRIEDASDYFDVSELAIRSHLINNDLLSRDALEQFA